MTFFATTKTFKFSYLPLRTRAVPSVFFFPLSLTPNWRKKFLITECFNGGRRLRPQFVVCGLATMDFRTKTTHSSGETVQNGGPYYYSYGRAPMKQLSTYFDNCYPLQRKQKREGKTARKKKSASYYTVLDDFASRIKFLDGRIFRRSGTGRGKFEGGGRRRRRRKK